MKECLLLSDLGSRKYLQNSSPTTLAHLTDELLQHEHIVQSVRGWTLPQQLPPAPPPGHNPQLQQDGVRRKHGGSPQQRHTRQRQEQSLESSVVAVVMVWVAVVGRVGVVGRVVVVGRIVVAGQFKVVPMLCDSLIL